METCNLNETGSVTGDGWLSMIKSAAKLQITPFKPKLRVKEVKMVMAFYPSDPGHLCPHLGKNKRTIWKDQNH